MLSYAIRTKKFVVCKLFVSCCKLTARGNFCRLSYKIVVLLGRKYSLFYAMDNNKLMNHFTYDMKENSCLGMNFTANSIILFIQLARQFINKTSMFITRDRQSSTQCQGAVNVWLRCCCCKLFLWCR